MHVSETRTSDHMTLIHCSTTRRAVILYQLLHLPCAHQAKRQESNLQNENASHRRLLWTRVFEQDTMAVTTMYTKGGGCGCESTAEKAAVIGNIQWRRLLGIRMCTTKKLAGDGNALPRSSYCEWKCIAQSGVLDTRMPTRMH